MVEMEVLVSKFPLEWRGLFAALDQGVESERYAELWLTETLRSQYGDMASWADLLVALCGQEPVTMGTKLDYRPRLLAFPLCLQRRLLGFIHLHRERFPPESLQHLTQTLESKQDLDQWLSALIHMIKQYCKSEGVCGTTSEEEPIYVLSSSSQSRLSNLFKTLEAKRTGKSDDKASVAPESQAKIKTEEDMICEQPEVTNTHTVIDVDMDEPDEDMPLTQTQSRNFSFFTSQRSRFEASFVASQRVSFLEARMQAMFDRIKELWFREQKASAEDLQLFTMCNQDQMNDICKHLELGDASEGVLVTACEQYVSLSQHVSYSSAVSFARLCVLPSVLKLEKSATRNLMATLLGYTKTFPKQSVDGILVPCCHHDNINSSHTELLSKILKESFTDEHKQYFLRKYLDQGSQLKEAVVPILQQLLDSRVSVDEDGITQLVGAFELSSLEMSGNLKFGKLLLALITKYSKQLRTNHVNSLRQTVESNNTFLKKSCLTALNKLKL